MISGLSLTLKCLVVFIYYFNLDEMSKTMNQFYTGFHDYLIKSPAQIQTQTVTFIKAQMKDPSSQFGLILDQMISKKAEDLLKKFEHSNKVKKELSDYQNSQVLLHIYILLFTVI